MLLFETRLNAGKQQRVGCVEIRYSIIKWGRDNEWKNLRLSKLEKQNFVSKFYASFSFSVLNFNADDSRKLDNENTNNKRDSLFDIFSKDLTTVDHLDLFSQKSSKNADLRDQNPFLSLKQRKYSHIARRICRQKVGGS